MQGLLRLAAIRHRWRPRAWPTGAGSRGFMDSSGACAVHAGRLLCEAPNRENIRAAEECYGEGSRWDSWTWSKAVPVAVVVGRNPTAPTGLRVRRRARAFFRQGAARDVLCWARVSPGWSAARFKGTLPCPNQTNRPMENTRKNSKNSKTLKTLDLGVSLQGTTFPKKHTKNSADSDRSESLQERRRVRFGNRTLPLTVCVYM